MTRRFVLVLAGLLACGLASARAGDALPLPGKAMQTPVADASLDHAAYAIWDDGAESSLQDARDGARWVIWTATGKKIGHSGCKFSTSKTAGPRHLRIGFNESLPVGSVITRGNVRVSALRDTAVYPGDLSADDQWLAARRWHDGERTTAQAQRDEIAVWVFPAGIDTRALRFTHDADRTDADYTGWLGGVMVLQQRLVNLAPKAQATAGANDRHAGRLNNGDSDGWRAWENASVGDAAKGMHEPVSPQHPHWVQLTWPQPVDLTGLVAVWAGFGAATIQAYTGPEDVHPRDASSADWSDICSVEGFESGYPATFWPNYFAFPAPMRTRGIRVLMTAPTPVGHPHVVNKVVGGRRVWLGELLAVQDIGDAELVAPAAAREGSQGPHPPIAVPFHLSQSGYVTLVIEGAAGRRVRNLVSETWFPAGDNIAWWDGMDDLDRDLDAAGHGLYNIPGRFVAPGDYTARGLWHQGIRPFYEFTVYTAGNPPWSTPDHTGAWLANHSPPSAAAFVPAQRSPTGEPAVFLGCYITEGPDGMAWVDLDGRKHGGMKWIEGNWTSAPYLAADVGSKADARTVAYVASVWETEKRSGILELRITALEKSDERPLASRAVLIAILDRWKPSDMEPCNVDRYESVRGIAAFNGVIACSLAMYNRVLFVDAATGEVIRETPMQDPRGVAFDAAGQLLVLSGNRVMRLGASPSTVASFGLEDPIGITLDSQGNIFVSDHGDSHQVKVFSPDGRFLRAIGQPGKPRAGVYNPLHMNHPAGIAVDSRGQLWVTEHDFLPKRVSVWSLDGDLLRAFYGPSKYGGGGMLDAHDNNRFYYADETRGTLEFHLDWNAGTAKPVAVLCRTTDDTMPMPFRSAAPEKALYRNGKRYFTNCYNTNPTNGHNTGFLYIDRGGVAQPAAGVGMANEWALLKTEPFRSRWPEGLDPDGDKWRNGGKNQALFVWSDLNADAHAQPDEVVFTKTTVRGITVMNDLSFCIANADGKALRLHPTDFSDGGVPTYDFDVAQVLARGVLRPMSSGGCQLLADDSDEAVVTLGVEPFHSHSICGIRAGQPAWSYPNPWPGLHASHHAAKPDRPGQVIGATRLLGGFVHPKGSQVKPLWAVNANMGNFYLFTRDGLFVSTVFRDVRQARLWRMQVADRGMDLDGISLHDENFWPSISQTPDGQVYVVDGSYTALVRLDGLDTLAPIESIEVTVTPQHLADAQLYLLDAEAQRQTMFGSGVLHAAIRAEAPVVDGDLSDWAGADWVAIDTRGAGANFNSNAKPYQVFGALAATRDRLYAAWNTHEPKLLRNTGDIPNALFKTGGAVDIMLGCDPAADPDRREPVAGDLRLLIAKVGDATRAMLYRQVAQGADAGRGVPFSSPWRTVTFDVVKDVSDQVQLAVDAEGRIEASIALFELGLDPKPGLRLRGDIGILRGVDAETTVRSYWSNKATAITSDVPSEVMLTPHLWGTIEWMRK